MSILDYFKRKAKDLLPELLRLGGSFLPGPLKAVAPIIEKGLKLLGEAGVKLPTPEAVEAAVKIILTAPGHAPGESAIEAGRAARKALHEKLRERNRWGGRTHDSKQRADELDGR